MLMLTRLSQKIALQNLPLPRKKTPQIGTPPFSYHILMHAYECTHTHKHALCTFSA